MPRHLAQRGRARPRWRVLLPVGVASLALTVVGVDLVVGSSPRSSTASAATPIAGERTILAPAAGATTRRTANSTTAPVRPASPAAARVEGRPGDDPAAEIGALTADLGQNGVSVAAVNLKTGATLAYGATSGMTMGSIAKLDTLEALLLQHQDSKTVLSDDEVNLATLMIEQSDNDTADALWSDVGSDPAVTLANQRLGIPNLTVGTSGYWGLGTTAAGDQLTLLKNLVAVAGPLDAASQSFALGLMRSVTSAQRWGVGTIADSGTTFANKNGWLANDDDDGRWLVNSDGIVTVHGQQVLISVLTQHNASEDDGIALVEAIAQVVAAAIVK